MKTRLLNNEILLFEMKNKMRRVSSIVLIGIVLGIATSVVGTVVGAMSSSYANPNDCADAGRVLFIVMGSVHFVFSVLLVPTIAGSSIASERERQTLDMLLCSQMTPKEIVLGKYLASVCWTLLISAAALPVYMAIYLLGGVTIIAVIAVFLFISWITMVVAAFAIFYSSLLKRSGPATALTIVSIIGIVGLLFALVGLQYYIISILQYIFGIYVNPFWNTPFALYINPIIEFITIIIWTIYGDKMSNQNMGVLFNSTNFSGVLCVIITTVFFTLLTFLLLRGAVRRLDPMAEKEKREVKKLRKAGKL